ncbi:MAG TPA: hypothetical protein DEF13_00030, partial [Holosporales bacterium]|nr:hypothetical protein [Holosporales bacterium]
IFIGEGYTPINFAFGKIRPKAISLLPAYAFITFKLRRVIRFTRFVMINHAEAKFCLWQN